MLDAFFEDQDGRGITLGDLYRVCQISQIEKAGMFAAEEIDQIGRRQQQLPGANFALLTIQLNGMDHAAILHHRMFDKKRFTMR